MTRYRLTLEYDGTAFVGWQRQASGLSVQECLEAAVEAFTGTAETVTGAGRTDSGVHALAQVAHTEISREASPDVVCLALNYHLKPQPISVLDAKPVGEDFHARFSATARHYRYRILNRRAPAALERRRAWWVPSPLDLAAMQEGAAHLPGRHDFTSFRAAGCQAKSPLRTLSRLEIHARGEELVFELSAPSFLYNQVRIIVGTLKWVGEGRWSAAHVGEILAAKDRRLAGPTAPPHGLCLMAVDYGS